MSITVNTTVTSLPLPANASQESGGNLDAIKTALQALVADAGATVLGAGTAVIGHVIVDSAGNVQVTSLPSLPAGSNVIGHVIVDSGSISVTNGFALETGGNLAAAKADLDTLAAAVAAGKFKVTAGAGDITDLATVAATVVSGKVKVSAGAGDLVDVSTIAGAVSGGKVKVSAGAGDITDLATVAGAVSGGKVKTSAGAGDLVDVATIAAAVTTPGSNSPADAVQVAGADPSGKLRVLTTDILGTMAVMGRPSQPVIIQKANNVAASGTSLAATFGSAVKQGNTIVIMASLGTSAASSLQASDSLNNIYMPAGVVAVNASNMTGACWVAPVTVPGSCTITMSWTGSQASAFEAYEVQGIGDIDVFTSANGTSTAPSVTVTISQPNEIAFFGVCANAVATLVNTSPATPTNCSADSGALASGGSNLGTFGAFSSLLGSEVVSGNSFFAVNSNKFTATLGSSSIWYAFALVFRPMALQVKAVSQPMALQVTLADGFTNTPMVPIGAPIGGIAGLASSTSSALVAQSLSYIFNGSTWDRVRSGGATGVAAIAGAAAPGVVPSGNPVLVAGKDANGLVQDLSMDSAQNLNINAATLLDVLYKILWELKSIRLSNAVVAFETGGASFEDFDITTLMNDPSLVKETN
jgi:hypothetical protein